MKRFRRAAPTVLGTILVLAGLGLTLTASAAPVGTLTLGDVFPAIGPVLAVVGAIVAVYRGTLAAMRGAARAEIAMHDKEKEAHRAAAAENHKPIEDSLDDLNRGMATVLARLDTVAQLASEVRSVQARLRALEDRHVGEDARDPSASPFRRRQTDPDGADHTPERGSR